MTFVSLIFWGWVMGPLGALLAVPMTLLAKALLVDIDPSSRWALPLISLEPPGKSPPRIADTGGVDADSPGQDDQPVTEAKATEPTSDPDHPDQPDQATTQARQSAEQV